MSRLLLAAVVLAVTAAGSAGAAAAARPLLTYALPRSSTTSASTWAWVSAQTTCTETGFDSATLTLTPLRPGLGTGVSSPSLGRARAADTTSSSPTPRVGISGPSCTTKGTWRHPWGVGPETAGTLPSPRTAPLRGSTSSTRMEPPDTRFSPPATRRTSARRRGRATGGAFSSRFRVTPRDTRADPTSSIRTGPTCVCSSIRHSSPRGRRTAGGSRTSRTAHPTLTAHNWPLGSPGGTEPTGKSSCPRQKG
jgi:hypothetical protein